MDVGVFEKLSTIACAAETSPEGAPLDLATADPLELPPLPASWEEEVQALTPIAVAVTAQITAIVARAGPVLAMCQLPCEAIKTMGETVWSY
jgi:hypothetical protein